MVSTKGFTIVELLIVVVVIAILATITIVSYSGITAQANDAKLQTNARTLRQAMTVFKAQNSQWPLCPGSTGPGYSECFLKDVSGQFPMTGLPTLRDNGNSEINYVVINSEDRWAMRLKKQDGTFCKFGEKMYVSWYGSAPEC